MNQRWRIPRPQGATFQAAPDGSVYMVFDDKNSTQVLRDLFRNMNQLEEQVAAWAAAPQPAAQSSGGPNGVFGPGPDLSPSNHPRSPWAPRAWPAWSAEVRTDSPFKSAPRPLPAAT